MIATTETQDIKKEKILEAAYQRFLHYGYSKTTMNEIAGDICMSKALLYYYFPDKSQLYFDVMGRKADEYLETLKCKSNTFNDLKEAFDFQINLQHEFIMNNYNLFDFFRLNEQNLPDSVWDIVGKVHQCEIDILVNSIKIQVEKGNIPSINNAEEIVEILLDALHGVRVSAEKQKRSLIFHNKEYLEDIRKKRLLLCDIFIKGLKYKYCESSDGCTVTD